MNYMKQAIIHWPLGNERFFLFLQKHNDGKCCVNVTQNNHKKHCIKNGIRSIKIVSSKHKNISTTYYI